MSLLEKIVNAKDNFNEFNFKLFLSLNRNFKDSFYIKEVPKLEYENSFFNKLKKVKTMLNYDNDFIYDFLKNTYDDDFGIINPEVYSLGLRRIYYDEDDLSYSSDLTDFLESKMIDEQNDNPKFTKKVNPSNRLINSFSYMIINFFTENEDVLMEAKKDLCKANKYYFENDEFYTDFTLKYTMKGLACFKLQYSNSLIDLAYAGYHILDKDDKKDIKYVIKDARQYKSYLKNN